MGVRIPNRRESLYVAAVLTHVDARTRISAAIIDKRVLMDTGGSRGPSMRGVTTDEMNRHLRGWSALDTLVKGAQERTALLQQEGRHNHLHKFEVAGYT